MSGLYGARSGHARGVGEPRFFGAISGLRSEPPSDPHDPFIHLPGARDEMLSRRFVHRLLGWIAGLVLMACAGWLAHHLAMRNGLEQLRISAQPRLDLVAAKLNGELARFDYLPSLLETSPDISTLLDTPDDAALRERVSRYLRGITATAGADNLYVVQRSGLTLAAADWDQPGTPMGTDLSFRPYVRDALAQGRGRFFGVGFTTGRAGYYLAYALQRQGRQAGVATVKVSLDAVERTWRQLPGEVLVVDAREVVILASTAEWKLHPLVAVPASVRAEAAETRTYGSAELAPLAWQVRASVDAKTRRVRLDGVDYLASEREVNDGLWRVLMLDDEAPLRATARNLALTAGLACAVLLLLALAWQQRRRALRQQLASRQALQLAHDSLEGKVLERTAELRSLQNDLVHAGKLAALGQMSAGVVHELNQPLAAMRTLSDNAALLLEKGRYDDARGNLLRIASLTDRLGRLTQQLKIFAHKPQRVAEPVGVRKVVQDALLLSAARLRELDMAVTVEVEVEPIDLAVLAEANRLEQVLVNLIGNAVDAMAGSAQRRLRLLAAREGDRGLIRVSDSGPGIDADVLPRLFEPFVSTKPAGKGLGLGLMISAHIVREFGGRLRAGNSPAGGAEFLIDLPAAVDHPSKDGR